MAFYTYILRCSDGTYYVGHTDNLDIRMGQHSDGRASTYTARRRPLELIWVAAFETRDDAFTLERRLHGWSRAKKEALMRGDFDALPELARCKAAAAQPPLALRQAQGEREGGEAPVDGGGWG